MEWVIPAIALLLLIWAVIVHRRLVALRQEAVQAWSVIDAQFRQRQDRIPRLLEAIQGHAASDGRSARAVIEARRAAANARSPSAIGKAEVALNAAIEKLLATGAAHPDLKADPGFRRLRSEFPEMETRIEASRRFFDAAAKAYNTARMQFPAAFLTYIINFPALERLTLL